MKVFFLKNDLEKCCFLQDFLDGPVDKTLYSQV